MTTRRPKEWKRNCDELRPTTPCCVITLDAHSGALLRLEDPAGKGTLLRGGKHLWVVGRHKAGVVSASGCAFRHEWNAEREELPPAFKGREAEAVLVRAPAENGLRWRSEVKIKRGTWLIRVKDGAQRSEWEKGAEKLP